MNTRFAIFTAAIGCALTAAPVLAAPPSVTVKYADLDLATPQGQAKLDRRIAAAAIETCGGGGIVTGSITRSKGDAECVATFKALAHQQVAARQAHGAPQG